jgi:hypothetical protein
VSAAYPHHCLDIKWTMPKGIFSNNIKREREREREKIIWNRRKFMEVGFKASDRCSVLAVRLSDNVVFGLEEKIYSCES